MRHLTIVSASLNEDSKSRQLARLLHAHAIASGVPASFIDLRDIPLPLAGSAAHWEAPAAQALKETLATASHIVLAVPIYNYDVNAAAKNMVELAGDAFTDKVVGFLCAAGGPHSYMSVLSFANTLMLDYRSVIVPRFVYAMPGDWQDPTTLKPDMQRRLEGLLADLSRVQLAS